MTAICVDDEILILEMTMTLCQQLSVLDEVMGFCRTQEALEWLKDHSADIALLDIDMPDMNGMVLAQKIQEQSPNTAIIFLTGYGQFALDAFKMHASGYVMKPISRERLAAEVEYAISNRQRQVSSHITIRTFGDFDIMVGGSPVRFSRSKSKELLALLIDRQGSRITRAEAFSILWENKIYDRPMQKQMDVVVRSLRTTLDEYGIGDILELQSGSLRIRPELVDCDLYRFLSGDREAAAAYRGQYMNTYSWAVLTEANIDQRRMLPH